MPRIKSNELKVNEPNKTFIIVEKANGSIIGQYKDKANMRRAYAILQDKDTCEMIKAMMTFQIIEKIDK